MKFMVGFQIGILWKNRTHESTRIVTERIWHLEVSEGILIHTRFQSDVYNLARSAAS